MNAVNTVSPSRSVTTLMYHNSPSPNGSAPSPVPDASIALRFHDFRVVQYALNHLFADFGMPNVVELLELVSTLKQRRLPWQGQIEELTGMDRISRIILGATPLSCSILYISVDHRRFAKSCVTHMPFGLIAKPRWTSS